MEFLKFLQLTKDVFLFGLIAHNLLMSLRTNFTTETAPMSDKFEKKAIEITKLS